MIKDINPNLVMITLLAAGGGYLVWRTSRAVGDTVSAGAQAVNPVNRDNIFARTADRITQIVTGDDSTSLGSSIYDWINGTRLATPDELRAQGTTGGGLIQ